MMDAYGDGWCDGARAMIEASQRNSAHFEQIVAPHHPKSTDVVGETIKLLLDGMRLYVTLPPLEFSPGEAVTVRVRDGRSFECPARDLTK